MKSKVVISNKHGGFGISEIGLEWIAKHASDLVVGCGRDIPSKRQIRLIGGGRVSW